MKQTAGGSFLSVGAGDPTDDFCCGFVEFDLCYFAADTEDLSYVGKIELAIEIGTGPDLPDFKAAMPFIESLVLRGEERLGSTPRYPI